MKKEHYKNLRIYKELSRYSLNQLYFITNVCCDSVLNKYIMSVLKEENHFSLGNLRIDQLFIDFYTKYRNFNFYKEVVFSSCNIILDLAKDSVLSFPWNKSRLLSLFEYFINKDSIWKEDSVNHNVIFVKPFNIFFVDGGNHSIATGRYFRKGIVHCNQMIDYSFIIKNFDFDGKFFRDFQNHKINKPFIEELGILFLIGKVIVERNIA